MAPARARAVRVIKVYRWRRLDDGARRVDDGPGQVAVRVKTHEVAALGGQGHKVGVLDGFAVEAYRQGLLSASKVGVLMGLSSRWETEDFLAAHEAWPGTTAAQVAEDGRRLKALLNLNQ